MPRKIAIIGGGIAGLAAGCYARMNDYDAEIFEAHNLPGGLCTSWQRKGYTIDGCIHWLVGSAPGTDFHTFWRELGVFPGTQILDPERFARFAAQDGKTFDLYTDADRLEAHLRELSPVDYPRARALCDNVRLFSSFAPPMDRAFETMGFFDYLGMMGRMGRYMKPLQSLGAITIEAWARQWRDPLLQAAWPQVLQNPRYTLQALVLTLADLHRRAAGFPAGGSLALARRIEQRFLSLGGRIRYRARVERILTEGGRATGIRLSDGSEVLAGVVISAADLRHTVNDLLQGRYREPQHEALLREVPVLPSGVLVSLGIRDGATGSQSGLVAYELPSPISVGGVETRWLPVRHMGFDPALAPAGSALLEILVEANYGWWSRLQGEPQAYRREKRRVLETVLTALERVLPGARENLEMSDVATPLTFERYTGSWHGTYMTWIQDADSRKRFRVIRKTLPGLESFYLCGMWLMAPGGVPVAVKTARDVIQLTCRADRKKFVARPSA
jgi:phytoene dehydrogenase-like protein